MRVVVGSASGITGVDVWATGSSCSLRDDVASDADSL